MCVGNVKHSMRGTCCVWRALKALQLTFARRYHVRTLLLDLAPYELLYRKPSRCSQYSREWRFYFILTNEAEVNVLNLERELKHEGSETTIDRLFNFWCVIVKRMSNAELVIKVGKEKKKRVRQTKPPLDLHSPLVPSCWAAFKFVQGQSGTRYNPPASPVQHQQHSGRNILPPT